MQIFLHELRSLKHSIIFNIIIAMLMLLIFTFAFLLLQANHDSIHDTLYAMSEFLPVLGINLESFFTPLGFYSFLFLYISVISAFFASSLGIKMITKEYNQGTVVFLLTKPIPRRKIIKYKNFAALLSLGIYHIVFQVVSIILFIILDGFSNIGLLMLLNFTLLLTQVSFLYISLIIASYVKNPKIVGLISAFTIIAFLAILVVEQQFNFAFLRFINPFSIFNATSIFESGSIYFGLILNVVFIIVFSINFAYGAYENDDVL